MSTTLAKQFEGFADCCLELARSAKTTARRARFMQMAREYHLRPGNADHNGGTNWPSDSVNLANSARSMRPELASIIFAIGLLIGFLLGYGVRKSYSREHCRRLRRRCPPKAHDAASTNRSVYLIEMFEAVEFATLEWVNWFNYRRLLEPIGNIPPAEAEERYYAMLEQPAMAA